MKLGRTRMSEVTNPLVLDLLEWVARQPRSHAEAMEAWRTSCPRLTVWEEAIDSGFLLRAEPAQVTPLGLRFLAANGRRVPPPA
jgi:hypothetical protein